MLAKASKHVHSTCLGLKGARINLLCGKGTYYRSTRTFRMPTEPSTLPVHFPKSQASLIVRSFADKTNSSGNNYIETLLSFYLRRSRSSNLKLGPKFVCRDGPHPLPLMMVLFLSRGGETLIRNPHQGFHAYLTDLMHKVHAAEDPTNPI